MSRRGERDRDRVIIAAAMGKGTDNGVGQNGWVEALVARGVLFVVVEG